MDQDITAAELLSFQPYFNFPVIQGICHGTPVTLFFGPQVPVGPFVPDDDRTGSGFPRRDDPFKVRMIHIMIIHTDGQPFFIRIG